MKALILVCLLGWKGVTTNFIIITDDKNIAKQCAQVAEQQYEIISLKLTGKCPEPQRPRCIIYVYPDVIDKPSHTQTTVDGNKVTKQEIYIYGKWPKILKTSIPHEVSHVVLSTYLGYHPVRWADEGLAMLAEDEAEYEPERRVIKKLDERHLLIDLEVFFSIKEYPKDVDFFYAQCYSVTKFLVELKGYEQFVEFIYAGEIIGWEAALKMCYDIDGYKDLKKRWRSYYEK